jgi:hypothetical protein
MNVKISKELNLLVFVGELSGIRANAWNKERRREWTKKSGGRLSADEQNRLSAFAGIFSKVSYDYTEAHFFAFRGDRTWQKLGKHIGVRNAATIKDVLAFFLPRFDRIWPQKKMGLLAIDRYLKSNTRQLDAALGNVTALCGTTTRTDHIPMNLVIGSGAKGDMSGWCSRMGSEIELILECSKLPGGSRAEFLKMIAVHELFHCALAKSDKLKKLLDRLAEKHARKLSALSHLTGASPRNVLEELVISSFVPEGYLGKLHFKTKLGPIKKPPATGPNFVSVRRYAGYAMRSISKEYVLHKKQIDGLYVESLLERLGGK